MAAVRLSSSPAMVRYASESTGPTTDDTLTRALILSQLPAGPLKAYLSSKAGDGWVALLNDPAVSVNISPITTTPGLIGYTFATISTVDLLRMTNVSTGASAVVVEIRFNPTAVR